MSSVTRLPPLLRTFLTAVLFAGLCWLLVELCCIHLLHLNAYPYNRMILPREDDFVDYTMFNGRFQHFHSRTFFSPVLGSPFLYPAPLAVLYAVVHGLTDFLHAPVAGFTLLAGGIFLAATLLFGQRLHRAGLAWTPAAGFAAFVLFTSYPIYFEINRSNIEVFVWIFAGLGVWAFCSGKPWLAALFIGLAGSCKMYPYILVGLLVLQKQYRQAVFAFIVGGCSLLASLWAVTGNVFYTAREVAAGLQLFTVEYVLHRRSIEIGLDHSIFGLLKCLLPHMPAVPQAALYLTTYLVCAALLAASLFFVKLRTLPVSNQITFLTVASILLPPVSYDYTLLQLYTPFAVLVFASIRLWRSGLPVQRGLRHAFYCFALLLSPQNEFIYHAQKLEGQIKCIVLLILAAVSLWKPFEASTISHSGAGNRAQEISSVLPLDPALL